MDWTDFDSDNQATIMLSLVSKHGRSTPLLWLTVDKAMLKNHRNAYEYRVLVQLAEALPADVNVLIVADRGFGDQKLYQVLTEELKFDYLIRFRGNIAVTSAEGETRPAADWVGVGGRPRTLRNAFVTANGYQVGTVVCIHAKEMKEPWCLAASTATDTAKQLMTTYGKRWGIDIDQAWRLSRLCCGGWGDRRGTSRRQASPRHRRCAHGLQGHNGSFVRVDEFGVTGTGFYKAAA